MSCADYALTLALLGAAVTVLLVAARTPALPPEPDDDALPNVDPFACQTEAHEAMDPLLMDVATQNLFVLVAIRRGVAGWDDATWLCSTTGCRQVHRTKQGAEFCSMVQFDAQSYTRPLD